MQTVKRQKKNQRRFVHEAFWCGLVFALVVVMLTLNIFPPLAVHYDVSAEVLITQTRLQTLEEHIEDRAGVLPGMTANDGTLKEVVLLDGEPGESAESEEGQDLLLVRVTSSWPYQCSTRSHETWLESITKPEFKQSVDSSFAARENRMARWELYAAEHYVERHDFLNMRAGNDESNTDNSGKRRKVFQLASHSTVAARNADEVTPGGGTREMLEQDVELAANLASKTELAWQSQVEQSLGLMEVTSKPEFRAQSGGLRWWTAANLLIVGLASGAVSGWFQQRLHYGGTYDPIFVAAQLQASGLPNVGALSLASPEQARHGLSKRVANVIHRASRLLARNLTMISESCLCILIILIIARLASDPMWRAVFVDSPLAAFARVFSGLP